MSTRKFAHRQAGFTFPELLVVSALILVFLGAMLILVRPADYSAVHRNAQRRLGLAQIMQAVVAYKKETGSLPATITTEEKSIATQPTGPSLCEELVPKYIPDLPLDPVKGEKFDRALPCSADLQAYDTGYIVRLEDGYVVLASPHAELGETISLERWFPLH